MDIKTVTVFCGASSVGIHAEYRMATEELGKSLAASGINLVYGGGRVGLMGVLADAALTAGTTVTGVIPQYLMKREIAHHTLTELIVVESMHQRKAKMAELADAFIALPGGFGTLEEFCEVLTWSQLGMHAKPCALLNINGFFDGLKHFFDHITKEGFVKPIHRELVIIKNDVKELLESLSSYKYTTVPKWSDSLTTKL